MRCFVNEHPYIILELALRGDTLESGLPILVVNMDVSYCDSGVDMEDDFRRFYDRTFGHWKGAIYSNYHLSEDDRQAIAECDSRGWHGYQLVESKCACGDIERDFEYAFSMIKSGRSGFGFGGLHTIMELIEDYHMDLDIEYGDAELLDQNISVETLAEIWEAGGPTPWPDVQLNKDRN